MKTKSVQTSRAEHAYRKLIEAIHEGSLKPGSRIRETQLAEWLGISRTPIREAIRRLESEGLICHTPHQGMSIATLDYQSVMELYQMREVLEATAAGLAAKHASEAEIYTLQELLKQQKESLNSAEEQARNNKEFHNALYHAAHNRYLLKSLSGLSDAMTLLGTTTYVLPDRQESACSEHQQIVQAIESNDPFAAQEASRNHIKAAQRARIKMISSMYRKN